MISFADRLKFLRKEQKLTQQNLADILNIKRATIAKWESKNAIPDTETLDKISIYFDTSIDYLIGKSNVRQIDKSVSSNWIHSIKTTLTKILDIPKDSQLQKRIEEELNFKWNKYIKKYPDLPIYSKIDWIPYQELELKNYNEIIENKDKRDILKKSILCAYLGNENIFDIHYYLIKKWRLNELEIKHLNNIFLEVEEYHYLR
ncbi:helix-turn-helix domain-containing protein [Streptococcus oralis]|uniref:helix-turn-helix domain-containing protein n=1 Tax=Streptococcus oralis TaxID=1303 RepID=UPI0022842272|nr:helix-turn-helix transcriptional regulator [Streptococcus oralis]MCY7084676.1 helix-turn-helix domain-containing protein [Streptococcus oralis]